MLEVITETNNYHISDHEARISYIVGGALGESTFPLNISYWTESRGVLRQI